jgi:hypothetical protein
MIPPRTGATHSLSVEPRSRSRPRSTAEPGGEAFGLCPDPSLDQLAPLGQENGILILGSNERHSTALSALASVVERGEFDLEG